MLLINLIYIISSPNIDLGGSKYLKYEAEVTVDLNLLEGEINPFWNGVDIGYATNLFRPIDRSLISEIKRAGFDYIRLHEVVRGLNIYVKDKTNSYTCDFDQFDALVGDIIDWNFNLCLVLESVPNVLSENPVPFLHNPYLPKDITSYAELVYRLVSHCINKYSESRVRNWYFEIWNEPTHIPTYFKEDVRSYVSFSDSIIKVLKKELPWLKVGGPAAGGRSYGWIKKYKKLVPPNTRDFFSVHVYEPPAERIDWGQVMEKMKFLKEMSGGEDFLITEWNLFYSSSPLEDRAFMAAFGLKMIILMRQLDVKKAFFFNLVDTPKYNRSEFSGYLGLFTPTGIPKPIYNLFLLLKDFSGEYAKFSTSAPEIDGLCAYSKKESKIIIPVLTLDPEEPSASEEVLVKIRVKGLGKKRVKNVLISQIDSRKGSSFFVWEQMGSPKRLSFEQFKELREKSKPSYKELEFQRDKEEFILTFQQEMNSVSFIQISVD